jgi:hypothetical protein
MRRTALLLITAGALAACGSSSASSSGAASSASPAPANAHCGPASARTLARGSLTRVYVERRTVHACVTGGRRPITLGTTGTCLRAQRVDAVAVAGRLVAAGRTTCGIDTGTAEVEVVRASDGHRLFTQPAIGNPGPESSTDVTGMVVTPAGATAWIARSHSIVGHRTMIEVRAGDARGIRLLDSGAQIVTGTLRLSGSTVSWRDGSTRRSARL